DVFLIGDANRASRTGDELHVPPQKGFDPRARQSHRVGTAHFHEGGLPPRPVLVLFRQFPDAIQQLPAEDRIGTLLKNLPHRRSTSRPPCWLWRAPRAPSGKIDLFFSP